MLRLKSGVLLLTVLAFLSGCRTSTPPKIIVCIADGVGGMDCVDKQGTKYSLLPSQTENMWCTTQEDMAAFSSWCYDTNLRVTESGMRDLEAQIRGN